MSEPSRILVVDDDQELAGTLRDYLSLHGYSPAVAGTAQAARRELARGRYELMLLDVLLPDGSGLDLAREISGRQQTAIIMLTGQGEEIDRVTGLELGADDYVVKPVSLRELLARVRSVLRRRGRSLRSEPQGGGTAVFAGWRVDLGAHRLWSADGEEVALTSGEYELLRVFLDNPERVLSREQLLDMTRGRERDPFDRSVDVLIGRLRRKLKDDGRHAALLVTVRGAGYRLAAQVDRDD
jgi:two-component system, OmpR family, response regulator